MANNQSKKPRKKSPLDRSAYVAGNVAEKVAIKVSDNMFPNLDVNTHRLALIESCINTDSIFKDRLTDPSVKAGDDMKNFMFYNQLYFLAAAQIMQPSETGSLLPGIVGGLSMIAGAAIVNDDFRKNLKDRANSTLVKYLAPFKDSAPKLWQSLNARVEAQPGCLCPESIALKMLRYQKQANDMLKSGSSAKYVNSLLLKKSAELKQAADEMNIDWDQVVNMRDKLSNDMTTLQNDREQKYGKNYKDSACNEMDRMSAGLSDKVGGASDWKATDDCEVPIDVHSVAKRIVCYQKQLQEAVEELHDSKDGDVISSKYAHLSGKTEDEYFASTIKEVAELKKYAEKVLHLDWDDVAEEYDNISCRAFHKNADIVDAYEKYVDKENRNPSSPHYGERNATYHNERKAADPEHMPYCPSNEAYRAAKDAIREHNLFMHYELPIDAKSAGRCLKKYQQDAYENVRDIPTRHNYRHASTNSSEMYHMSNELCKQVRAASQILGFNWDKAILNYRKDVFKTVLRDERKSAIWKEISNGDLIVNIPENTVTYTQDKNGNMKKEIHKLSWKERINAWDGKIYDSNGNAIPDGSMIQVRDPYTKDEAKDVYTNLFSQYLNAKQQESLLKQMESDTGKDVSADLARVQSKIDSVNHKCDEIDKSLIDDRFSPSIITEIREEAMSFFTERESDYTKNYEKQYGSVKLDESLAPGYGDDTSTPPSSSPAIPDFSM